MTISIRHRVAIDKREHLDARVQLGSRGQEVMYLLPAIVRRAGDHQARRHSSR